MALFEPSHVNVAIVATTVSALTIGVEIAKRFAERMAYRNSPVFYHESYNKRLTLKRFIVLAMIQLLGFWVMGITPDYPAMMVWFTYALAVLYFEIETESRAQWRATNLGNIAPYRAPKYIAGVSSLLITIQMAVWFPFVCYFPNVEGVAMVPPRVSWAVFLGIPIVMLIIEPFTKWLDRSGRSLIGPDLKSALPNYENVPSSGPRILSPAESLRRRRRRRNKQ